MRRSEKELSNKANFDTFNCSDFRLKNVKHLGVTKTFKEIKFGLIWDKVKAKKKKKKCSQK